MTICLFRIYVPKESNYLKTGFYVEINISYICLYSILKNYFLLRRYTKVKFVINVPGLEIMFNKHVLSR